MDLQELSISFLNKIPKQTSIGDYIFKTQWRSDEISIQIIDSQQSKEWDGSISHDELKQSAEELEIPYQTFFDECKEALTLNGGVDNFKYLMEDDKFTLTKNDEFQIQYLEADMKPNGDLRHSMILTAVDLIASLRSELSVVAEDSKGLNEKYQAVVKTLDKCLLEKNMIERKLLKKFSVLLNSKKDKIAELQDLLLEKNNKLEEAGESDAESRKRNLAEAPASSVAGDDFMQPTQIMTQPIVNLPKRRKCNGGSVAVHQTLGMARGTPACESIVIPNGDEVEDSPDIFDEI